jgi:glycerophosphoryl diester phosphodiesterase
MRIGLIALLPGVLLGCSEPRPPMQPTQPPAFSRPKIVAHRGASYDAPENTLAAFQRAWAHGVEAIELDVRVTRDGEVVVIHDATTQRTGSADLDVAQSTLAQLATIDVGAWKGPQFAGEGIPTLRAVLATIPPGRSMFVEIKSPISTVPAVAAAVRAGTPTSATILLQGYDADTLAALAAALPEAAAYWTVDPPVDERGATLPYPQSLIDEAKRRGFPGLALGAWGMDLGFLAAAKAADLAIGVWTLNDVTQLAEWAARDVRWIETDRPDLAPVGL